MRRLGEGREGEGECKEGEKGLGVEHIQVGWVRWLDRQLKRGEGGANHFVRCFPGRSDERCGEGWEGKAQRGKRTLICHKGQPHFRGPWTLPRGRCHWGRCPD